MVVVAIVALAFGGVRYVRVLRERSVRYRDLTPQHRLAALQTASRKYRGELPDPACVSYHGRTAEKYERAGRYPWLPVGSG
jgi:hypothetical protein